jgi:hypothetical protein
MASGGGFIRRKVTLHEPWQKLYNFSAKNYFRWKFRDDYLLLPCYFTASVAIREHADCLEVLVDLGCSSTF